MDLDIRIKGTMNPNAALAVAKALHNFTLPMDKEGGPPRPFLDLIGVYVESIEIKVSPVDKPTSMTGTLNVVNVE